MCKQMQEAPKSLMPLVVVTAGVWAVLALVVIVVTGGLS